MTLPAIALASACAVNGLLLAAKARERSLSSAAWPRAIADRHPLLQEALGVLLAAVGAALARFSHLEPVLPGTVHPVVGSVCGLLLFAEGLTLVLRSTRG